MKRRNPIAKELSDPKYRAKVEVVKTKYKRTIKYKDQYGIDWEIELAQKSPRV